MNGSFKCMNTPIYVVICNANTPLIIIPFYKKSEVPRKAGYLREFLKCYKATQDVPAKHENTYPLVISAVDQFI